MKAIILYPCGRCGEPMNPGDEHWDHEDDCPAQQLESVEAARVIESGEIGQRFCSCDLIVHPRCCSVCLRFDQPSLSETVMAEPPTERYRAAAGMILTLIGQRIRALHDRLQEHEREALLRGWNRKAR